MVVIKIHLESFVRWAYLNNTCLTTVKCKVIYLAQELLKWECLQDCRDLEKYLEMMRGNQIHTSEERMLIS